MKLLLQYMRCHYFHIEVIPWNYTMNNNILTFVILCEPILTLTYSSFSYERRAEIYI